MGSNNYDELSKLAYKYLSDKCPQIKHPFTPYYFELLKDKRQTAKKVLEIGIGYREMALNWRNYRTGASLLMWREFFPYALIYGIDVLPQALYNGKHITSILCDQTNTEDLYKLISTIGSDIDLIVDDGSHKTADQIFSCLTLMPIVNKNVIYIIEDVSEPEKIIASLTQYDCVSPELNGKFKDDHIVVVTNKK